MNLKWFFFPQYLFLLMLFLSLSNWTLCVCFAFYEPEHFLHCICCFLCSFLASPFCFSFFFHSFCCLLCCCFVSASLTYWAQQSCAGKSPFHLESRCPESRSCKETARFKTAFRVAETLMKETSRYKCSFFVTVFVHCSPASSWWARRSHLSWSSVAGRSSIVCFRSVL